MKELYELKEKLVDELKNYGKMELTNSTVQMIDTLAHAAKNVCKIIDESDEGNSGYYPRSYDGRYRGSFRKGYSRHGLSDKLRELMEDAPDEATRMELQRLADKM